MTDKSNPLVSVVIPTYNRDECIERALNSVLNQTYRNIELIVVDDCSTDNTKEIIQSDYPEVNYIRHEQNKGGGPARNTGIENATGKFIAFLDSDDKWLPTKLEKQVQIFLQSDILIGAVYCGFYRQRSDYIVEPDLDYLSGMIFKDLLRGKFQLYTSTLVIPSQILNEVGNFDNSYKSCQEYDLMLKISRQYTIESVNEPLIVKYQDSENRISMDYKRRLQGIKRVLDIWGDDMDEVLEKNHYQFFDGRIADVYFKKALHHADRGKKLKALKYLNEYRHIEKNYKNYFLVL